MVTGAGAGGRALLAPTPDPAAAAAAAAGAGTAQQSVQQRTTPIVNVGMGGVVTRGHAQAQVAQAPTTVSMDKIDPDDPDRPKKRRNVYATDEERRMARILKNRRTAEESRQRRLQKMKDLEALAQNANEREAKLREEIGELRTELALKIAENAKLKEEIDKLSPASK